MQAKTVINWASGSILLIFFFFNLVEIFKIAHMQWQEPIFYGDTWNFIQSLQPGLSLRWLFEQHNEHRIVFSKIAGHLESFTLGFEPYKTALIQSLVFIALSIICWAYLCFYLIQQTSIRILVALSGCVLLTNPWQGENLWWEFQVPWHLINFLVLFTAIILSINLNKASSKKKLLWLVCLGSIPWLSVFATGQGIALAIAACVASYFKSLKAFVALIVSTLACLSIYFFALGFEKPRHHPSIQFNLDFFSRLVFGGLWIGMSILIIVPLLSWITNLGILRLPSRQQAEWLKAIVTPSILVMGLFSLLFSIMTTLSRSGLGVAGADAPRYVTHTCILPLSIFLASGILSGCQARSGRLRLSLIDPILLILVSGLSYPAIILSHSNGYVATWKKADEDFKYLRDSFRCEAMNFILNQSEFRSQIECGDLKAADPKFISNYFSGSLGVRPAGWHLELLNNARSLLNAKDSDEKSLKIKNVQLEPESVLLQGWIRIEQPINRYKPLLIASYTGNTNAVYTLTEDKDSLGSNGEASRLKINKIIPRNLNGQRLKSIKASGFRKPIVNVSSL